MVLMKCLATGSTGNCYLLKAARETLVIECGISIKEIKRGLEWRLENVAGCLVTHRHKDHSKSLVEVLGCGIKVLAIPDVFEAYNAAKRPFTVAVETERWYKMGGFKVMALAVRHDVPCVAWLVEHKEMGRLLFVTDTMMLDFKLPQVDHLMLEVNYADRLLEGNIMDGVEPPSMRARLLATHMELGTACGILRDNDISRLQEVIVIHYSSRNGNRKLFKERLEAAGGVPVIIAEPDVTVVLPKMENCPY